MIRLPFLLALLLPLQAAVSQPILQLQSWATGFTRPVDIASAGDDRLFIVEQRGLIHILDAQGQRLDTPYLNIQSRVNSGASERGLLGLVFHPDYAENGYFYVNYTNTSGHTRVSRFRVSAADPDVADPDSELVLISVNQPYANHNAGDLNFGPDGYLYFGLGDGGSGGDPQNFSQNRQSLLGKMIRINVDSGSPYAIPPDNPFVNDPSTLNEIWAIGLRNPWKFSFDRLTGDMWIGDVGQNAWEEIDFQPASSTGGENYGWRCYEGNNPYNTSGCQPASAYTFPVRVYANNFTNGCSVTGGFVYRGNAFPDLYGHYLYTDYCSGRIWSLTPNGAGGWTNRQLTQVASSSFVSFGEDRNGELYLASLSGAVFRVRELCSPFRVAGAATDETCAGDADGRIDLGIDNPGATHTITWSTGANTPSLSGLTAGTYSVSVTNSNNCTRAFTFTISNATPQAPVVISQEITLCEGESATIEAPEAPQGAGYQWYIDGEPVAGAVERSIGVSQPGDYTVAFRSAAGCFSLPSAAVSVAVELFPVDLVVETRGDTLFAPDLDRFIAFQWLFDGEPVPGAEGLFFVPAESGAYSVRVLTLNGCTFISAPVEVLISSAGEPYGLQRFEAAPNPTRDLLSVTVETRLAGAYTLRLVDASGKTVWTARERVAGAWRTELDMSRLPAGIYSLALQRGRQVWALRKVIKQ